jgi:hypothetical protein
MEAFEELDIFVHRSHDFLFLIFREINWELKGPTLPKTIAHPALRYALVASSCFTYHPVYIPASLVHLRYPFSIFDQHFIVG